MNIKQKRLKQNLSQLQVANAVGISRASYTNIENKKRLPSVKVAKRIAELLKFDWTAFYEEDKQKGGG